MSNAAKRDNGYWKRRLEKDGHGDLLARVEAGVITMYKATQIAGYRAKRRSAPAAQMSYHWKRAGHDERKHFVVAHLKEVNRVMREVAEDIRVMKAEKPSE